MCGEAEENLTHFLLTCKCLEFVRKPIIEDLISSCSKEIARFIYKETKFDILQLIVDPFVYIGNFKEGEAHTVIHSIIEPKCRRLCYNLHCERYKQLHIKEIKKKKEKVYINSVLI